jgi:hypothetical protein
MNNDFDKIRSILIALRDQYAAGCKHDLNDPALPITERDIVADIRYSLMNFCKSNGYHVHCEIRPAPDDHIERNVMKKLPRIDVVILRDGENASWFAAAKKLQGKYPKGSIEARFSSVPIEFFHTAIEAKIQSKVRNAKYDIDLLKEIQEKNPDCNCFFVLLNARGRICDHQNILAYAQENHIEMIGCTANHD